MSEAQLSLDGRRSPGLMSGGRESMGEDGDEFSGLAGGSSGSSSLWALGALWVGLNKGDSSGRVE